MSDGPEKIWVWKNEPCGCNVATGPDQPHLWGSPEYTRSDLVEAKDAEVKRLREALWDGFELFEKCQYYLPTDDDGVLGETLEWQAKAMEVLSGASHE